MRLIDRLVDVFRSEQRTSVVALLSTWQDGKENLAHNFLTYAQEGMKGSTPVFSLIVNRLLLFSEAEFQFRNQERKLFGTPELAILERPWVNGTTRDLLAWMELDLSLAGNFYAYRPTPDRLQRLRPDWVTIVADPDGVELFGYIYRPGGDGQATFLPAADVAHYAPIKDPLATWRGMSWLTPAAREVDADTAMTRHKNQFFKNAATPQAIIKVAGELKPEARKLLQTEFDRRYASVKNAYKTVLLEGGADFEVVGSNFEQMTFATIQGIGESRLASAAGVPPVIVGFSEGLKSATYSNYQLAARRFADATLRPLWGFAAGALASILTVPDGARLWYDDRYIPFLQQDAKDEAEIRKTDAVTIEALIRSGYEPGSVVAAVTSGDFGQLVHSGLVSVQLQPPADNPPPEYPDDLTVNERRALDGLGPIDGGDAIYMPASNIPAIEVG